VEPICAALLTASSACCARKTREADSIPRSAKVERSDLVDVEIQHSWQGSRSTLGAGKVLR
jgi:hypothetical protein